MAVNAMVVKNVKDANVPLKLLPIYREYVYVNAVARFGCKTYFSVPITNLMPFKTANRNSSKFKTFFKRPYICKKQRKATGALHHLSFKF